MRSGPRREKMLAATSVTRLLTESHSWEPTREEADMAVEVEIDKGIAVVTMNRPQALNAFNSEQLDLLGAAFHALGQDRSVRVVILTGAGDRAFAAGADIKEMVDLTPAGGLAFGARDKHSPVPSNACHSRSLPRSMVTHSEVVANSLSPAIFASPPRTPVSRSLKSVWASHPAGVARNGYPDSSDQASRRR